MGSTTTQYTTQTNSNIGAAQKPYYDYAMRGAMGLLNSGNPPMYDRDRIEGFTDQQKALQGQIAGMQTPGQFGQATDYLTQAGLGTLAASRYDPAQFNAQQVGIDPLTYYQMQGPESFTQQGMMQQYMSPFIQAALEPQLREAQFGAQRTQLAGDLGAARQGTYGGSRALLASMERERNLGQNLSDIRAKGYQTAFEQAQGQFNTEQQARQAARMKNLESMLGVQELGTKSKLSADQANQQYGLEAQRLAEMSRQYGASNALKAYEQMGQYGQTMSNIGSAQQQADLARLGLQRSSAAEEQALNQQMRDIDYQDFVYERDYPWMQYQRYMNLLSAVPVAQSSTSTQTAPAPSLASQLVGSGLGAYSTYKMLNG